MHITKERELPREGGREVERGLTVSTLMSMTSWQVGRQNQIHQWGIQVNTIIYR